MCLAKFNTGEFEMNPTEIERHLREAIQRERRRRRAQECVLLAVVALFFFTWLGIEIVTSYQRGNPALVELARELGVGR
jgi:hypothetical protein